MEAKYKRVLLKVSGEALAGEQRFGINEEMVKKVAKQVKEIKEIGVEVAVVVGGGNFWRGRTSKNMDRATADYIGMMATVMNAMPMHIITKCCQVMFAKPVYCRNCCRLSKIVFILNDSVRSE